MEVRGALRLGRSRHPTIGKYSSEHEYWKRFGLHLDPRPLEDRPWLEVLQYDLITQEALAVENESHKERPEPRPMRR